MLGCIGIIAELFTPFGGNAQRIKYYFARAFREFLEGLSRGGEPGYRSDWPHFSLPFLWYVGIITNICQGYSLAMM